MNALIELWWVVTELSPLDELGDYYTFAFILTIGLSVPFGILAAMLKDATRKSEILLILLMFYVCLFSIFFVWLLSLRMGFNDFKLRILTLCLCIAFPLSYVTYRIARFLSTDSDVKGCYSEPPSNRPYP